jgi:hypothetical protein
MKNKTPEPPSEPKPLRYFVEWRCDTCGYLMTGFLTREERPIRYCMSIWGPLLPPDAPRINGERPKRVQFGPGESCGRQMRIERDERPQAA